MNAVELLCQKRDGRELSPESIDRLIQEYAKGSVPDYQMAAFAMAVYLNGMTELETVALTEAMRSSGETLVWKEGPPVVDKHSTGGVGDKVSLVLAPLMASVGFRVPMISGRGLGPTGGTLDKLEAIPGFRTNLSTEDFQRIVNRVGCAISGATADIAPADKKLYALRDVTGTVASIPLITASIMSKKLAEGLAALVLDVKFGSGAFMKTLDDARDLAASLVRTGRQMNVGTQALLTDMNQPLGQWIGNAVEVEETIQALKGDGPEDLMEVTLALGAELLVTSKVSNSIQAARSQLQTAMDSGLAFEFFEKMVAAQGGDLAQLPTSDRARDVPTQSAGFVSRMHNEQIGWAVIDLGGGRRKLDDAIDPIVGLEILVRIGDRVDQGQPWIRVHEGGNKNRVETAVARLVNAIEISTEPVSSPPLIVKC